MSDQEFLRHLVRAGGVVMQVDAVTGVGLDISFKGSGRREGFRDLGRDRGCCSTAAAAAVATRHAIPTAEDEVLVFLWFFRES